MTQIFFLIECTLVFAKIVKNDGLQILPFYSKLNFKVVSMKTTIKGKTFIYWADFIMRCTYAKNSSGEIKAISSSGYINNDLTVRKAIACAFNLPTFRK